MALSIAIVISCYNKAPYVECALRAVLAQVRQADAVVFVDDGSTDDSLQIAQRFAAAHPELGLRVITQPNSGQPAHARNAGIATVNTDLIVCLDADDSIAPLYLHAVLDAFTRDPDIGLAYPSGIGFGDGPLRPIGSEAWDPARLAHTNYLLCITAYRREIWEKVGGYRTNVRGYEDWDLWIAASALGYRGAWIPLQLFHYREMIADGAFAATAGKDLTLRATIVLNNPTVYDAATREVARLLCDDAPFDVMQAWGSTHEILRVALLSEARRCALEELTWAESQVAAGALATELQRLQQLVRQQRMTVHTSRQLGSLLILAGERSKGFAMLLTSWALERQVRHQTRGGVLPAVSQAAVPTPDRAPRILSFMPYGRWNLHALQEITILHGARLRGAEVKYVMCNGAFRECDMHWGAVLPRHVNACAVCMAGQRQQALNMQMPHEWLLSHVTEEEQRTAASWAASMPAVSLRSATWESWTIGEWVMSSVHSHFRANRLDPANDEHVRVMRAYLEGGLVTAFAMQRLLRDWRPDVVLQFNGRQASTRVALRLAQAAGVRVVVHERGSRPETLYLAEGTDCLDPAPIREAWSRWREVPLTDDECAKVAQWMTDRAHGRNMNWVSFSAAPGAHDDVRARLGLRSGAPLLVVFTSSEDEYVGSSLAQSAFGSQEAWLEATVAWAEAHPEVDFVIRIHPNTGSERSRGRNAAQLAWLESLAARLPCNARMLRPDDALSSYTLMELATGSLAFVSTVGIEAACRGLPSFMAAAGYWAAPEFTDSIGNASEYDALLTRYCTGASLEAALARRTAAFRFAYMVLYRYMVPFPLVRQPTYATSEITYTSVEALRPGCDASLDRVLDVLLDGAPVCPDPDAGRRADVAGERAWHLQTLESSVADDDAPDDETVFALATSAPMR